MSGKNQYPFTANWQSTSPVPTFRPVVALWGGGSQPSAIVTGTMSGTNTIYSNIIDISRMDNIGLEVAWSGTPTGTFSIMVSNSGINFNALTFTPPLAQPAGSAAGMAIDLNQVPFKYMMLQYVNVSGAGSLAVYGQSKDLN